MYLDSMVEAIETLPEPKEVGRGDHLEDDTCRVMLAPAGSKERKAASATMIFSKPRAAARFESGDLSCNCFPLGWVEGFGSNHSSASDEVCKMNNLYTYSETGG